MNVIKKITQLFNLISAFLLLIIVLNVSYELLSRYIFNNPWPPSSEITMLLFPWMVFFCSITITNNKDHFEVNIFKKMLPAKIECFISIIIRICILLVAVIMCKSGIELVLQAQKTTMPMLKISKSWLYLSLPFAFLNIIIFQVIEFILINTKK